MSTRVNPERTRRYMRRTLARPSESWTLTQADLDAAAEWERAWMLDEPGGPPLLVEWRWSVTAWGKAKGVRIEWMATPPSVPDCWPTAGTVLSWKETP